MKFGVGQGVQRVEDHRFLTGTGRYTDDIDTTQAAHLCLVRSEHAHADIAQIDTQAARGADSVLAVYTAADLAAAELGDIPCLTPVTSRDGSGMAAPGHPVLARGRVRHVGDPLAAVVAETAQAAADAAELVEVSYEPRDHVVDTAAALDPAAPQIWDEAPANQCFEWGMGDDAATQEAVAQAAHVVRVKLVNSRVVVNAMEPRAALGEYEPATGVWRLTTGTQGVFGMKKQLAEHILRVDPSCVEVVTPDVGGGFGMKIFVYGEQVLVLHAAKELGRPVRWCATRSESFQSDNQGRDHISEVTLAFDRDYRLSALHVDTIANLGAYLSNYGPIVPTVLAARMLPGVYRVPTMATRVRGVFTNTVPVDAYRGAGRPEATYAVERSMDVAARELGLSPSDLRARNFVAAQEMPYETATGMTYDCGDFHRIQDEALRRADHAGLAERKQAARAHGRFRGMGHVSYVECCGGIGQETARFRLERDGTVTLFVGTQSNGQGHATAYAQLVSERLGLTPEQIAVRQGDTRELPSGGGTGGSRSLLMGGGAVVAATDQAIERMKEIAGRVLEASPQDIAFEEGVLSIVGTDRSVTLAELAGAIEETELPGELAAGVDVAQEYSGVPLTYPNGCHVCEVDVDGDTGEVAIVSYTVVDDMGTLVNPMLVAGQIQGGTVQGIGQALAENTVYDPDSGQLLTASYQDYTMPRAADVPSFDISFVQDIPCATNPFGIKGAGEAGAIGAPPAVINAIVDALAPLGVTHIDMPATPQRIWTTMQEARHG